MDHIFVKCIFEIAAGEGNVWMKFGVCFVVGKQIVGIGCRRHGLGRTAINQCPSVGCRPSICPSSQADAWFGRASFVGAIPGPGIAIPPLRQIWIVAALVPGWLLWPE